MTFGWWCGQVTATIAAIVLLQSMKWIYEKFKRGK